MQQLKHYSWVIRHWSWLILLGVIICSSVTFGISKYILKPVYQASALLQVNGLSASDNAYNEQAYAVSDSLLITSNGVLQEVAQKIPNISLSQLEHAVSASPESASRIIEVRAQSDNPQQSADIANMVMNVFIQQQIGQMTASLKSQDAQLSQNLQAIKSAISQDQAQLAALQKSGASASQIASQNDILSTDLANYGSSLANERQVQLQESQVGNTFSIEQSATPPSQPTSPQISLNTLIAAALGLLLMIVLTLLLDWSNTTIQTPEDVAKLALLEPLGSVPLSNNPLLINQGNPTKLNDNSIQQAFMVISTCISAMSKDPRSILVCGLRERSGVTTTATNLAISLAQIGKRVLLVDANLHRSSLHSIFASPNNKGLVNSLTDVYQFHDGTFNSWLNLWRTTMPNLWFIPSGSAAPYPQLSHCLPELRILKNWLLRNNRKVFDRALPNSIDIIIFDAPALNEGTDAIALASVTDGSILVVQAGKERNEVMRQVGTTLQKLGSPLLGVIVNRQTHKHRPYFYADAQSQKVVTTDNSVLNGALALSLLTGRPFSSNTPPSLLSVSQQNGSTREQWQILDGAIYSPPEVVIPSTPPIIPFTPFPLERSKSNQFKLLDPNH